MSSLSLMSSRSLTGVAGPGVLLPLEAAFGVPLGGSGRPPLPAAVTSSPRRVLDELLVAALARPPCLVAFSGGRDSSALLSAATLLARREGLERPVAVTARFPQVTSSEESSWQIQMVRHLGLSDWERIELTDELDLLGPYARQLMAAHGNLWAFNAHFSAPLVERARGGTLVTGIGGDEVFGNRPWPRAAQLLDATGPWPHRLAGRILDAAPRPLRRWAVRGQLDPHRPWMTAPAARVARRAWADWMASHPVPRDRALRQWLWPSRYWQLARDAMALVGDLWGADILSPFMEPQFVQAAAHRLGPAGRPSRADSIEHLLGPGLLPDEVRGRTTKATFDLVFFGRHSRAFIADWDGSGLDPDLVDPRLLHREWRRQPRPDARSYSLLKAAWLSTVVGR